jgi:plastocyanin
MRSTGAGLSARLVVSAVLGASTAVAGCNSERTATLPERTASPPERTAAPGAGRIRGTVLLQGSLPSPRSEPIEKDHQVCGREVQVTRLSVGKGNGVGRAFVYLDGVPSRQKPRPRLSLSVGQERCEYAPHVMTAAVGTPLEIVNGDPILHNVHARETTELGPRTVFNIAQPIRGQRTTIETALSKPGIVALTCEAGHPWMTAYVLVADHPHVAVTNDDGEFVLTGIPAGTYGITMWHEGVRLKQIFKSVQQYEYEEPYQIKQEVVVPEGGEATVNFSFELRTL